MRSTLSEVYRRVPSIRLAAAREMSLMRPRGASGSEVLRKKGCESSATISPLRVDAIAALCCRGNSGQAILRVWAGPRVGYRFFAERVAGRLWVSRVMGRGIFLMDVRGESTPPGAHEQLESLREELRRGPRMAQVDRVEGKRRGNPERICKWIHDRAGRLKSLDRSAWNESSQGPLSRGSRLSQTGHLVL